MGFFNERISSEDANEYNLSEIDKKFVVGGTRSRSWTIGRERNMYIRIVSQGREDIGHQTTWTFFWGGELLVVELDNISTDGEPGGRRQGHKKLRKLVIPKHLEVRRQDILNDLKEALTAYKDGGVYATASEYSLVLDI